nr:2-C-methyl-D-erythritol 4-phosphate cytidylyltransferase [Methyloceanibacter marginalis]
MASADAARLPLRCDPCRASRRGAGPTLDFTDDAAVAEWFGLDVALVEGAEHNRKPTAEDSIADGDDAAGQRRGHDARRLRL